MAILANNQQDEQNNQQGPTGGPVQTANTGAPTSGKGSVGASTPQAGQSNVAQGTSAQNNEGYTDVGSYLDANQAGSAQLGQQVASNLTQGYNTAMGDINGASNAYINQINQGYTPENSQLINQVANDPITAALDPNQTSAYQAQLNDSYAGPTSWNDTKNADGTTNAGFGTLQGEVANAQQMGSLINTPGGTNVLVQPLEGSNTSAGINNLDSLLLGGNPGAVQTVQAASAPYANLGTFLDSQNAAGNTAITTAQNNAAKASQDALNAFTGTNGTLTNLNTSVTNTSNQALSQAQAQQAQLKADIAALYGGQKLQADPTTIVGYGGSQNPWYNTTNYTVGNLSDSDLSQLGMTRDQWNSLQQAMQAAGTSQTENGHNFSANSGTTEVDLNNFLNSQAPTAAMINPGSVATQDQYNQMLAINDLLGDKAPTQTEAFNPLAYSGTYNPAGLNSFDYEDALAQTQAYTAQQIQAAKDQASALTSGADLVHAQSQHGGGFFGGLKQDIMHPLNTIEAIANPLSQTSDVFNLLGGHQVSPTDDRQPGAQIAGGVLGGVVGGIYGGPMGAVGGASAGSTVGKELEDAGNKNTRK